MNAVAKVIPYRRSQRKQEPQPYYTQGGPTLLSETPSDPKPVKSDKAAEAEWATLYNHYESRRQALYSWRLTWWNTAGQIARYMRPERFHYYISENTYDRGLRRDQAIVDRTATLCGEICASGLMGALTDPDSDWLELGPAIPGFELDQQGQSWYQDLTERYNYILAHCNFYDAQAQHYDDLVFFGNAPIIDYESADEIIHCFTPCSGEYMLGAGFDFSDEVFYREFRLTVSQMVEMFGPENLSEDILGMWRQKGGALEYEQVIGHAIEPNFAIRSDMGDSDVGVVPGGFTWRENYWVRGKKDMRPLATAGFHEQPFAVSRWNTTSNDAYGRGIGEYMLGDCIQLQLETRQKAESIEKVNRPPMGADVSLQNLPASTNPGKITYMNTGNGGEKKFWSLYEIRPDIPALSADIALIQERIAKTAKNDIFRMMENLRNETKERVTATEIDAIKEEVLMHLGPVIGRIYGTLRQRVKRHFAIMNRRGLIPPKPASLQGVPTNIGLVSTLTRAQRAMRTQNTARTAQFLGVLAGTWPQAKFLLDVEQTGRSFNDDIGGNPKTLVTPQAFKKAVQLAAQQEAQNAAMAQTVAGSQAAAGLAKTTLSPGNALSALVPGGGGQ